MFHPVFPEGQEPVWGAASKREAPWTCGDGRRSRPRCSHLLPSAPRLGGNGVWAGTPGSMGNVPGAHTATFQEPVCLLGAVPPQVGVWTSPGAVTPPGRALGLPASPSAFS